MLTDYIFKNYYQLRTEYDGRLCFYRCLSVNREEGVPQGTYTPGKGTHPPPQPGLMGEGVPQGTYPLPPTRSDRGGDPKVPTPHQGTYPLARSDGGRRVYPRYLPPRTGQHMEYLIRRGRYASCVHGGGLSCSPNKIISKKTKITDFSSQRAVSTCDLGLKLK